MKKNNTLDIYETKMFLSCSNYYLVTTLLIKMENLSISALHHKPINPVQKLKIVQTRTFAPFNRLFIYSLYTYHMNLESRGGGGETNKNKTKSFIYYLLQT